MAARREITKKYAREYARVCMAERGELLNALVATTAWIRDHARGAMRTAAAERGAASDEQRTQKPREYSYEALLVLKEVWRLAVRRH